MDKITDKLDNINTTLEKILNVMNKPENPFLKFLAIAGMFVGVLGIITLIDTIIGWFMGGLW